MKRFEVKDVYISDVVLGKDYAPKRKFNIQVELNFEAQQNLRDPGPTTEELAEQLGDEIARAFSSTTIFTGAGANLDKAGADLDKKEIIIRPTESDAFGWYELNAYNQKVAEDIKKAYQDGRTERNIDEGNPVGDYQI